MKKKLVSALLLSACAITCTFTACKKETSSSGAAASGEESKQKPDTILLEKDKDLLQSAKEYMENADLEYPNIKTAQMLCILGDIDSLKKIEKSGFKTWSDPSLIEAAAKFGNVDVCKFLVSKGASGANRNALMEAAARNSLTVCKYLIFQNAPINESGALHVAAVNGHMKVCQYLIAQGADVNYRVNDATPLYFTLKHSKNMEIAKFLVSKGASVEKGGPRKTARVLVTTGRSSVSNEAIEFYEPMLHTAALAGDIEFCKCLVALGANVNSECMLESGCIGDSGTALYKVIDQWDFRIGEKDVLPVCQYLISAGADVNPQSNSPLCAAVSHRYLEICKLLVAHGADLHVKDKAGSTPIDIAKYNHYTEIVRFFDSCGRK